MAKQDFTDEQRRIWNDQILGTKGIGLPSRVARNLVDVIYEELRILPDFSRHGEQDIVFDVKAFKANDRSKTDPDGFTHYFYDAERCARNTGSKRGNWLDWANLVLGYGRKSHPLAPYIKPPQGLVIKSDPIRYRFLSLELVVFYLAIQTDTWENPGRILSLKDRIKKLGIDVITSTPVDDDLNVSALLDAIEDSNTFSIVPERRVDVKTSLPKSGKQLVEYNPILAVAATADGVQVTRKDGVVSTTPSFKSRPTKAEEPAMAEEEIDHILDTLDDQDIIGSGGDCSGDPKDLSEEELANQIAQLQATLAAKKAAREAQEEVARQAALRKKNAESCVIVAGEVFEDRGQYEIISMAYADGTTATYYHQDVLRELVG
jgi:hypothetical protein